ncbi:MAG: RNA polymerase sigma factor [Acidobacteria bacterium]|nr:RNA polymerase sigma factor [Acidobacteriota bacterium]
MTIPESLLRELTPQVLGTIVRRFGDFSSAEDAVQEALLAAALRWPEQGMPDNPRGWLIQVAARRMTDHLRTEIARRRREAVVMVDLAPDPVVPSSVEPDGSQDDTLILLCMCCHPALTRPSAIALTLRAVGGLTTAQIARAFMVPETTMGQRISRAKHTIMTSGIPFVRPTPDAWPLRLDAVLHVLYLIFNEGYAASDGEALQAVALSEEAIRLARLVLVALPQHPEVMGLLALMLLSDARRPARAGPDGDLIPLQEQDRRLWNRQAIVEGTALLRSALAQGAAGPYQLQAAIAALHDEASTVADTDWPQILALYRLLETMTSNPMVTLNRVVAHAMVHGPAEGLEELRTLDRKDRLAGHHRLFAVRAHLLEMSGDTEGAIDHYRRAADKTASLPEQRYLLMCAARLRERTGTPPE